jgi:transketolase
MPNLVLLRPGDAAEAAEAWRAALERRAGPTALVLTRQKLPVLDRTAAGMGAAAGVRRGGYVLWDPPRAAPQAILLGTGSELHLAFGAGQRLSAEGVPTRVVSLPSWELFRQQPASYRDSVLPPAVGARVSIEAAVPQGWQEWVGSSGASIGLDHYGASAPAERLFQEFGITVDAAIAAVRRVMTRNAP